jgi:hypothetical protein
VWRAGPQLLFVKVDGATLQALGEQLPALKPAAGGAAAKQQQQGQGAPQLLALSCGAEKDASDLAAACDKAAGQVSGVLHDGGAACMSHTCMQHAQRS